jgi:hypothetical protein
MRKKRINSIHSSMSDSSINSLLSSLRSSIEFSSTLPFHSSSSFSPPTSYCSPLSTCISTLSLLRSSLDASFSLISSSRLSDRYLFLLQTLESKKSRKSQLNEIHQQWKERVNDEQPALWISRLVNSIKDLPLQIFHDPPTLSISSSDGLVCFVLTVHLCDFQFDPSLLVFHPVQQVTLQLEPLELAHQDINNQLFTCIALSDHQGLRQKMIDLLEIKRLRDPAPELQLTGRKLHFINFLNDLPRESSQISINQSFIGPCLTYSYTVCNQFCLCLSGAQLMKNPLQQVIPLWKFTCSPPVPMTRNTVTTLFNILENTEKTVNSPSLDCSDCMIGYVDYFNLSHSSSLPFLIRVIESSFLFALLSALLQCQRIERSNWHTATFLSSTQFPTITVLIASPNELSSSLDFTFSRSANDSAKWRSLINQHWNTILTSHTISQEQYQAFRGIAWQ